MTNSKQQEILRENNTARGDALLLQDLAAVIESTSDVWKELRGSSLFITGGTGFIGSWLLESLKWANQELELRIQAQILTRDFNQYRKKHPHLANYPGFKFVVGDVRNFVSPRGEFSHVIHGATDSSQLVNTSYPKQMYDTIVSGTMRVLDFAAEKKCEKVLLLSSGAVYGSQPHTLTRMNEDWSDSPNLSDPINAYAEGKRGAEMLAAIYHKQFGLDITIARIFALLGPYLPLEIHYAIGNFIKDAISGKSVIVNGSGLPVRSYLYASDLTTWLWKLMLYGQPGVAYNIGSEHEISLRDLAALVANTVGNGRYCILGEQDLGPNPGRYVPDTSRIRHELQLSEKIHLEQAIYRTALWYGWKETGQK